MKTRLLSIVILAMGILVFLVRTPVRTVAAQAGGSLSGTVKFEGTPPPAKKIDMSFDPNCSKAHPTPAMTEEVVTGPNGGLANVVVYVSDGLAGQTFQPPAQPVVLEQKGCVYLPHVLALQANQKLDVVNSDLTTHNIHPNPANNREWNTTQPHGVPIEQTFAREEVAIPVKCNVHPWMKGYIAVLKHPYFAVTDKNGHFEVKDLPPGSYTITAWQEKFGVRSQKITVAAGQSGNLDFMFKQ